MLRGRKRIRHSNKLSNDSSEIRAKSGKKQSTKERKRSLRRQKREIKKQQVKLKKQLYNARFDRRKPQVIEQRPVSLTDFSSLVREVEIAIESGQQLPYGRIDEIKGQLQELVDFANYKWKVLEQMGLESPAIYRALEDNDQVSYFDISNKENYQDILSEVTRAQVFINDPYSDIYNAELFTEENKAMHWKQYFGGQYNNWVYKHANYDIYNIDSDYAKAAFRIYRDLEGDIANWLQRFGSGESISLIYEYVSDEDANLEDEDSLDKVRERIKNFFERKYGASHREWEKQFEEQRNYYNFIYENVKYRNQDMEYGGLRF